ncbi:hypothetical protein ACPV4B_03330 [Vibrio parahaemolyticus]|uniref:hypothetical protein n=1 Tax=Vibrio mediterranei TaxID=689 RepID=UPI00406985B8
MRSAVTLFLTLLVSTTASANWFNEHTIDKFDGVETHRAWGFGDVIGNEYATYGIRCDSREKLLVTVGFATELEDYNAPISIAFKVDNYDPIRFQGQLFSNTKKSGFVRANRDNLPMLNQLILQSRKGLQVAVRVSNQQESQFIDYTVPLRGFSRFSRSTRDACGVGTVRMPMTAKDKSELLKLNQQLIDIKQRIAEIEAKYSTGF